MSFTHDDITSLGRKLDGIQFTDGERAALHGIIDAARGNDDEVSGFAMPSFGIALGNFAVKPLGGDELWVKGKPLGGDDIGWVKGKPLGGDDPGW